MLLGTISCRRANEGFVTICRISDDSIRIDYLDSIHGISEIKTVEKVDTLELTINVTIGHEQKSYDISIDHNIKFIRVGTKTFDLANIQKCPKVLSGQQAIDSIK